jgi:hypothetical protein
MKIIRKVMNRTKIIYKGVEWDDVAKYLKVNISEKEIDEEGLREILPKFSKTGSKKM